MEGYLHIGRHKSGTSSIQKVLSANREVLERSGYLYPDLPPKKIAHHALAAYFIDKVRRGKGDRPFGFYKEVYHNFLEQVNSTDKKLIVSSEAFQNCNPKNIIDTPLEKFQVVVYIRNQYDYLVSAYQQKVHATNYCGSIHDFLLGFNVDYKSFLDRWEAVFPGRVTVRAYERSQLIENDVIEDFLNIVLDDATRPRIEKVVEHTNPSIGGALLELKLHLNKKYPERFSKAYGYNEFSMAARDLENLTQSKPVVDLVDREKFFTQYLHSNMEVAKRYWGGENFLHIEDALSRNIGVNKISSCELKNAVEKLRSMGLEECQKVEAENIQIVNSYT